MYLVAGSDGILPSTQLVSRTLGSLLQVQGGPKIVPRVLVSLPVEDLVQMLQDPEETRNMMVAEVIKHSYDGLVRCTRCCTSARDIYALLLVGHLQHGLYLEDPDTPS